jgi:hypothetical protein
MNHSNVFYRTGQLPLFNNRMYHSEEAARQCATGDVILAQDPITGLVSNHAFEPDRIVYDSDYQNEQANSDAFRRHLDEVAALITRHLAGKSLIEVGCGKGGFLAQLASLGFDITGMDPAYEGSDPAIRKEYFTPSSAITGEGILLRHVLEHIPDPVGFLRHIRDSNGGRGLVYIEVPCLDRIIAQHSWFDIFYEHVNYFRLSDFHRMFGTVLEAHHSFHGQYLSVVADLSTLREPQLDEPMLEFPASFTSGIKEHSRRLRHSPTHATAIWGGASKGVIFAIHMMREGTPVRSVIDINPAKQGKFLAVTGLRVLSPSEAIASLPDGSDIIVMNPNYLDEIRRLTSDRYHYLTTDTHD